MTTNGNFEGTQGFGFVMNDSRASRSRDRLLLQSLNHPSMILVSTPLIGTNFQSWSRATKTN